MKKIFSFLLAILLISILVRSIPADEIDPDLIREAQMITLDLEPNRLLPDKELTEQILNDLMIIRATYPEFVGINFRPQAAPDELLVSLTESAAEQFENGQYHEWDDLNLAYRVIEIQRVTIYSPLFKLKFDRVYNTERLTEIYNEAGIVGIVYVEPNYHIGDGSTIKASPPYYTFIRKWGDCPAGCIFEEPWYFVVHNGSRAELIGAGEQVSNPDTLRNIEIMVRAARKTGYGFFRVKGEFYASRDKIARSNNVYIRVGPYDEMLSLESSTFSGNDTSETRLYKNRLVYQGESGKITRGVFHFGRGIFEIEVKKRRTLRIAFITHSG